MNRRIKPFLSFGLPLFFSVLMLALAGCGGGGGGGGGDALSVTSITPADGAVDLDPAGITIFSITFNKAMDTQPSTVPVRFIETKNGIDTDITDILAGGSWSPGDKTATVDVSSYLFKEGATYTITILAGIFTSSDGHTLAEDYIASFTTATTVPFITGTTPAQLETGVPTDTLVTINFSEPMDTGSFEDNASITGYSGTVSAVWGSDDSILTVSFDPALDSDSTYVLSLSSMVKDRRSTGLGEAYNLAFSTGSALDAGFIAGTIGDDPVSSYDDSLDRAQVILFERDPLTDDDPGMTRLVQAAAGGAYHFSWLSGGPYYVAAIVDSNRDGSISPDEGDAVGIYSDIVNHDMVDVDTSGVDFTLVDSEAILGGISFDSSTGDPSAAGYVPYIYAYAGTFAQSGEMYMLNDPSVTGSAGLMSRVADYDGSSNSFDYFLNPFFYPDLSVSGNFADYTVVPADRPYIPPGSYRVLAWLEFGGDVYAGFSSMADIADTGDDAVGSDIVLYNTTWMEGHTERIYDMMAMPAVYGSARISLLEWPLQDIATDTGGYFLYEGAPVGKEIALHIEPGPGETIDYLATNSMYGTFSVSGATDLNYPIVKRTMLQQMADLIPATLDPTKAQVVGFVRDSMYDPVTGATASVPGATTWYFTSNLRTAVSSTGGVQVTDDGPQFIIVNAPLPSTGDRAVGTVTPPGGDPGNGYLPLRADELTIVDIELDL